MKHVFQKGINKDKPVLLLLHGTGGNEHDLLPIARLIDEEASILSVRGNVLENGMPRFFRRLSEGVFDLEDLRFRTKELLEFLDEAAEKYNFNRNNMVAVGYSNGANIAGSLLFHYRDSLKAAVLFHPMVPVRDVKLPNLTNVPVFIGAGKNDPICLPEETKDLQQYLTNAGSDVTVYWESYGHQLSRTEVEEARKWYEKNLTQMIRE